MSAFSGGDKGGGAKGHADLTNESSVSIPVDMDTISVTRPVCTFLSGKLLRKTTKF
jgi:hypothetical protein